MSAPTPAPLKPPTIVLSMPKPDLLRLCAFYGAALDADLVNTDDGQEKPINGARLLWAMCGRESSFGQNMRPRLEPAYYVNGFYWRRSDDLKCLVDRWDKLGASSLGPLQIMACNAHGFTPGELAGDPEKALQAAVARIRLEVLRRQKARTIADICDAWNTGNCHDDHIPHEYIAEVEHHYLTEVMA